MTQSAAAVRTRSARGRGAETSQRFGDRKELRISWPNIIRIDHEYRPELTLDLTRIKPLARDAYETPTIADLAPVIDGKPDITKLTSIAVEKLGREQPYVVANL